MLAVCSTSFLCIALITPRSCEWSDRAGRRIKPESEVHIAIKGSVRSKKKKRVLTMPQACCCFLLPSDGETPELRNRKPRSLQGRPHPPSLLLPPPPPPAATRAPSPTLHAPTYIHAHAHKPNTPWSARHGDIGAALSTERAPISAAWLQVGGDQCQPRKRAEGLRLGKQLGKQFEGLTVASLSLTD